MHIPELVLSRRAAAAVLLFGVAASAWLFGAEAMLGTRLMSSLDHRAAEVTEESMNRALATFAAARGLNAVISVIKDSEILISPAGLGVSLKPAELLDPADDLVERFGNVMLYSTVALAGHRLLLRLGRRFALDRMLPPALLLLAFAVLIPGKFSQRVGRSGVWLVGLALVLRIGIPSVLILSSIVSDALLADTYAGGLTSLEDAQAAMDGINGTLGSDHLQAATPQSGEEERSLLGTVTTSLGAVVRSFREIPRLIGRAVTVLTELPGTVIDLTAAFLFETTVAPILLLWLLWSLIRQPLQLTPGALPVGGTRLDVPLVE